MYYENRNSAYYLLKKVTLQIERMYCMYMQYEHMKDSVHVRTCHNPAVFYFFLDCLDIFERKALFLYRLQGKSQKVLQRRSEKYFKK
jgi:hypothetical protein